jgi:hypothetical protein
MNAGRYIAGLCVSALGLCAAGWLVLTPFAFGYHARGRTAVTDFATGGVLALAGLATLTCWALAWRRKLRADGVLAPRQSRRARRSVRRQARAERLVLATRTPELTAAPDPAQVLTDLRALLTPLLAAEESALVRTTPGPSGPELAHEQAPPASRNGSSVAPQADWYRDVLSDIAMAEVAAAETPAPMAPAPSGPAAAEAAPAGPVQAEPAPAERAPAGPAPLVPAQAAEAQLASRPVQVQAPGHLRGTRSASFLAPSASTPKPLPPAEPLLRGAELLMVGTGEEEAW